MRFILIRYSMNGLKWIFIHNNQTAQCIVLSAHSLTQRWLTGGSHDLDIESYMDIVHCVLFEWYQLNR